MGDLAIVLESPRLHTGRVIVISSAQLGAGKFFLAPITSKLDIFEATLSTSIKTVVGCEKSVTPSAITTDDERV